MRKKISIIICLCLVLNLFLSPCYSQEETVTGVVQEVADDGSYVIIGDQKIMISEELNEMDIEEGDEVELFIEKTDAGVVAFDYSYI